jgi:hypothetical protein
LRPYFEKIITKKKSGGVAQCEGSKLKPQYHKNKQTKKQTGALSLEPNFQSILLWLFLEIGSPITIFAGCP